MDEATLFSFLFGKSQANFHRMASQFDLVDSESFGWYAIMQDNTLATDIPRNELIRTGDFRSFHVIDAGSVVLLHGVHSLGTAMERKNFKAAYLSLGFFTGTDGLQPGSFMFARRAPVSISVPIIVDKSAVTWLFSVEQKSQPRRKKPTTTVEYEEMFIPDGTDI